MHGDQQDQWTKSEKRVEKGEYVGPVRKSREQSAARVVPKLAFQIPKLKRHV